MGAGDEARKRLLRRKYNEQAMEAAFDDDLPGLRRAYDHAEAEGCELPVDPPPPQPGGGPAANSYLSEAACGGACECLAWLLGRGADPDRAGEHGRVPLTRALSNDRAAAVAALLAAGADPRRCFAQQRGPPTDAHPDGELVFRDWDAHDVGGLTCGDECRAILAAWDIERTFAAQRAAAAAAAAAAEAAAAVHVESVAAAATAVEDLRALRAEAAAALEAAVGRRERRIAEYDTQRCEGAAEGDGRVALLGRLIREDEEGVRLARVRLDDVDRRAREAGRAQRGLQHRPTAGESGGWCPDVTVPLAQVDDVIVADVGGVARGSGRHATLVADPTGDAASFLAYREVLLLDVGNSHQMQPLQLRASVLGALRFGRPLVVSLRDHDPDEAIAELGGRLAAADPRLPEWIAAQRLPAKYRALVDDAVVELNPELALKKFSPVFTERFRLCLLSESAAPPSAATLAKYYVVRVE